MRLVGYALVVIVAGVLTAADGGSFATGAIWGGGMVFVWHLIELMSKAAARIDEAIDAILEIRKELAKR